MAGSETPLFDPKMGSGPNAAVTTEASDPKAPYAVPVLTISMVYHSAMAFYCYARYTGSGRAEHDICGAYAGLTRAYAVLSRAWAGLASPPALSIHDDRPMILFLTHSRCHSL